MRRTLLSLLVTIFCASHIIAAKPNRRVRHTPRMVFLENDHLRVGIDLEIGGAITYLAPRGDENMINNFDYGRQVQMSYFGGPVPFTAQGKQPHPHWKQIGWNPIQAGDHFGHRSRVLKHERGPDSLYVKCVPQHWPLKNVPGECTYESWIHLDGRAVRGRCRLTNHRNDTRVYPARDQELPAVYTNAPFHRLITYRGPQPFTKDTVVQIRKSADTPGPWSYWRATEGWSALVNDQGFGLGVWNPDCFRMLGGFAGRPGTGGTHDNACGYIAPTRREILDHNIVHSYEYALILGTVPEIREYVYQHARRDTRPDFRFTDSRLGWQLFRCTDTGWPLRDEWRIHLPLMHAQLVSPFWLWRAETAPTLYIQAAVNSTTRAGKVWWADLASGKFANERVVSWQAVPDGKMRVYAIDLSQQATYRGAVTALRIDPPASGQPGESMRIKYIGFHDPRRGS